jgi:hypothetical protein
MHKKYTRECLKGTKEEKKKIRERNHTKGKPSCRPSEEGNEKEM